MQRKTPLRLGSTLSRLLTRTLITYDSTMDVMGMTSPPESSCSFALSKLDIRFHSM